MGGLSRRPENIVRKFDYWLNLIQMLGLRETRKYKGLQDEPLQVAMFEMKILLQVKESDRKVGLLVPSFCCIRNTTLLLVTFAISSVWIDDTLQKVTASKKSLICRCF